MGQHTLSRFQVIDNGCLALPGKCAGCGTASAKRYVDFGLDLDFYGVVYFCVDNCFTEIANNLSYYNPQQYATQMSIIEVLRIENNQLRDRMEALDNVVNSIGNLATLSHPEPVPYIPVEDIIQEPESDNTGSEEVESGSNESTDVDGPSDVLRSDRTDLDDIFNI